VWYIKFYFFTVLIAVPFWLATTGAGMITEAVRDRATATAARPTAAEKLARLARGAASDAEAIEAVRKALEDLLT